MGLFLNGQKVSVRMKPRSALFVIGTELLDHRPKLFPVVFMDDVGEFVDDNVVNHFLWRHDEPPSE